MGKFSDRQSTLYTVLPLSKFSAFDLFIMIVLGICINLDLTVTFSKDFYRDMLEKAIEKQSRISDGY